MKLSKPKLDKDPPKNGERRVISKIAWMPTKVNSYLTNSVIWAWMERYWSLQEYEEYIDWGMNWNEIKAYEDDGLLTPEMILRKEVEDE